MLNIKPLTNLNVLKIKSKIVFSSSFFLQNDGSKFIVNNRTLIYIKGAIKSLLAFPNLIKNFVDANDQNKWYYYLYIDKYLTEPLDKSKLSGNDIHEIKILEIIWELVRVLIETIKNNTAYSNIVIFSYYDKKFDTEIGHMNFYGTMIRYYPFSDKTIDYLIVRNCRTAITPTDLLIQIDWIKSDKDFMLFINPNYNYNFDKPSNLYPKQIIEDYLKNKEITTEHVLHEFVDKKIYLRFYASLFSVKLKNNDARNTVLTGYDNFLKVVPNSEYSKYEYSVDEFALIYIFPYDILVNSNTYILNMVPSKNNEDSMNEYLYHIFSKTFGKDSVRAINEMIYRFGRGAMFPIIGLGINTDNELLECEYLHQSQLMASMDEIKPLAFATYYRTNNKLYKYNYKDLDISNFRQSYTNNYNWLSMGADTYVKNFDWKHNYDKENNNKYGKILPNDELNWFVSKDSYKPYEMRWIKLYFIDLSENSDSKKIAIDIFHCLKKNILKKPLIISVANINLFNKRQTKKTINKKSAKLGSKSCTIKKKFKM
jgi:hypothetical protein